MGVPKVAGGKYLVRLYFLQKIGEDSNVLLADIILFHQTCFIKRQIQEVYVVVVQPH